MKLINKINEFRRFFTATVFGTIGKNNIGPSNEKMDPSQIKKVLISRPNHRLGNMLLITPLVQEVALKFPNATIDLFVKGNLAAIVFEKDHAIGQIIKLPKNHFKEIVTYLQGWNKIRKGEYDLVINVDKGSSSGKLSTQLAHAKYKFFGDEKGKVAYKTPGKKHLAKRPVYGLRKFLDRFDLQNKKEAVPSLLIQLSPEEKAAGKAILDQLVDPNKKTICLFTFATGAKCYSKEWWAIFYERILLEFKEEYNILEVLPVENVSQLDFKATTFYSKDIREIASVFSNTAVFIGADSGMMHLASASQIPTIGLFSVTQIKKYKPFNQGSCAINTDRKELKDWIKTIRKVLKNN